MINNKVKCWVCDSGKITDVNIVSNIKITHLLCNECYFLFSNASISKNKKIKYYSNSSDNTLVSRYSSNEYFDTARFINYINLIIKKNCNPKNKINHLDIGGGFGFFSKVLKKKFPKINSFNLEPDMNAVKIANKLNKDIKTISLPFENINLIKNIKFDLVTYWGGIYRTIEPNKVFQDLKKICKKNCDFFFSLPFSFDDMRLQHLELQNSFDDILLKNDGVKGIFGRNHMKLFLAKNQFFFKEMLFQNKPFKKKIPIFYFNLKNKTKNFKLQKKELKNYFKKNISTFNNHFQNEIKKIINKEKNINKILIFGDNFLSQNAFNFLKNNQDKNVINIKSNLEDLYDDPKILKTILNLTNSNSNIFFIFESPNDRKIKKSLVNRLHIDINNHLYFLNNNFKYDKDIFCFEKKEYLKKKIKLIKI